MGSPRVVVTGPARRAGVGGDRVGAMDPTGVDVDRRADRPGAAPCPVGCWPMSLLPFESGSVTIRVTGPDGRRQPRLARVRLIYTGTEAVALGRNSVEIARLDVAAALEQSSRAWKFTGPDGTVWQAQAGGCGCGG